MRALLDRLRRETSGIALIEFAFVAPILIVLYLAGYQVSDAIGCNRKVTMTTRTVADLVSQFAIMPASQVDQVLAASAQVMTPYPNSSAFIRVSEIATDNSGNSTIVWSRALNGAKRVKGSAITLPPTIKFSGLYYIYAETSYAYSPAVNFGFVNAMNLGEAIYMVPRVSTTVDCNDCT